MTPVPQVPESHSIKFSFSELAESFRIFALIEAFSPGSMKELHDSTGKPFFIAMQRGGWVSKLAITVHRTQQSTDLRTALIAAHQSGEEILVRDYDTAQIYKAHLVSIDPMHRTRIKWNDEYFRFEMAVVGEGVFNVQNESQITWRNENGELTPERGYPY